MTGTSEITAFWLCPAEPERRILSQLIGKLALRFDAPVFEPHLTIGVGPVMTKMEAAEILHALESTPLLLEMKGVEFAEEFTKTLFLKFSHSQKASELSAEIMSRARSAVGYDFDPHLSLIYHDMSRSEKEALATTIELPFRRVTFDSIQAISCRAPITKRVEVEGWRTLGERRLA
ncbi:MAG: hypothetical protein ABI992_00285 [Chthoniobacterales bacterium]